MIGAIVMFTLAGILLIALGLKARSNARKGESRSVRQSPDYIKVPQRPESINKIYDAFSDTAKGASYKINPYEMTCTCPDFVDRRANYKPNDVRRACKHLARFLRNLDVICDEDEFLAELLEESGGRGGVPHFLYQRQIFDTTPVLIGFSPSWSGVKVFSRERQPRDAPKQYTGPVNCTEYDLERRAWTSIDKPYGAREIKRLINNIVR
ncbi:MAG: hypothetical protein KJ927_10740 [Candidatus Eisenbacteria bacterium]|nr:hypothetical protein [Candidatus Eisenbacteria bacterium]MBU1949179.1 hypothetical protein [Candidatus Eisenbacteria bacterium]